MDRKVYSIANMAFICTRCDPMSRVFVLEGQGIPNCQNGHGPMIMQKRKPYRGPKIESK